MLAVSSLIRPSKALKFIEKTEQGYLKRSCLYWNKSFMKAVYISSVAGSPGICISTRLASRELDHQLIGNWNRHTQLWTDKSETSKSVFYWKFLRIKGCRFSYFYSFTVRTDFQRAKLFKHFKRSIWKPGARASQIVEGGKQNENKYRTSCILKRLIK